MSLQNSVSCETVHSREQIVEEVRQIVAEAAGIPPAEVGETSPLLRDLPWDSLDLVECSMEIEEQFDVSLPDEMVDEAKTVGDIADGVLRLLGERAKE